MASLGGPLRTLREKGSDTYWQGGCEGRCSRGRRAFQTVVSVASALSALRHDKLPPTAGHSALAVPSCEHAHLWAKIAG